MDDVIACEQCGQPLNRALGTYSSTGQLVCRACSAKSTLAATDDRVAQGRRAMRAGVIAMAIAVVAIPVVMTMMGAGAYFGYALATLGVMLLMGGRMARRLARNGGDQVTAKRALFVMLAGLALLIVGSMLGAALGSIRSGR